MLAGRMIAPSCLVCSKFAYWIGNRNYIDVVGSCYIMTIFFLWYYFCVVSFFVYFLFSIIFVSFIVAYLRSLFFCIIFVASSF